ncbi:polysaccharide pyruvyl transferase family protein [Niallia sp. Man26]|uniref:polysaccharide pyruvyl transferase family protein n=1 Tax=Niallia sp. Man26 TaxID=2912824 RepID=UPI001EDC1770|nr:polysaccharide pyruvyl transferase family protein [Niallia sp. Man26]UPO87336.1 polysaccharide pyruvyl transferase family protein [Niallia sp. Man26]
MKKVFISAYLNNNLGDDLFVKILCERYPQTQFYIYDSKKKLSVFSEIKNLNYVYKNFLFKVIDKFSNLYFNRSLIKSIIGLFMDAHIYIGGSLFMEKENWEKKIKIDNGKLINNKRNFLLGCNFGPFENIDFLERYKKVFERYDDICFRDYKSYELFKELSCVRVAQDVVFNLNYQKDNISKEKNIGISLIDLTNRDDLARFKEVYLLKLKDICEYYIKLDYNITLFSFCKYEGDEKAIEELLELVDENKKHKINVFNYENNLDLALTEFNKVETIYATRFHSMILGFLLNKKVYPIIYSKKMTNVLKDINFQGEYCNIEDIEKLETQALENLSYKKLNMEYIIDDSKLQFLNLDKYLVNDQVKYKES